MKRKPNDFAIANEITTIGFSVNKDENVINFLDGAQKVKNLWFNAKTARWLADKLLKSAEYLEQKSGPKKIN